MSEAKDNTQLPTTPLSDADSTQLLEGLPTTPLSGETTHPQNDPLQGFLIDGRYFIKDKLGKGGFGMVYLATDQKMLSRPVVVKVMLHKEIRDEWSIKKFKQEIEALARVDHPSIIGILDAGELPGGNPYIVMQFVDGISLRSAIRPEGVQLDRCANIVCQIGRALTAAHEKGILHRDLKPENVMLQTLGEGEEQVKIIDFGIAKVKNSLVSVSTDHDRTVGTIAYMSPEQLSAQPLSPASDVFSFAVIAYEMVTGRRPTNPESMFQLLEAQRAGVRVRPIDLRPALPAAADRIILKALSFAPEDRYQKAREFGDALARALEEDDERTKLQTQKDHPAIATAPAPCDVTGAVELETAHVLFMDIVGYSKMPIDDQRASLRKLQTIVRNTEEFQHAQANSQLISLPTGDAMALVFFGDPEASVRCAAEISQALKQDAEMNLRMGVHSGLVYRMADINTNLNVAGGGITIAQRVMDCGDAGHILVSKRVADDLGQLTRWSKHLHDIGETEVKHGVRVHLFNLFTDELGNSQTPTKLRPSASRTFPTAKRAVAIAVVGLVLASAVAFFGWQYLGWWRPTVSVSDSLPLVQQSFTYSLTVQKMRAGKPDGGEIEMTGQEVYGNGWKFRFNFQPNQAGALYLLNEGPAARGGTEHNILFPTPSVGGNSQLAARQKVQTGWNYFGDTPGIERLWIIWSAQPLPDLDAVFREAGANEGLIASQGGLARLQYYFAQYESRRPEVIGDKARELTIVKGKGDTVVTLVELTHTAY